MAKVTPQKPKQSVPVNPYSGPSAQSLGLGGSKTPYDPLGIPKTQGDFNQQVYQAAQSQYQPLLQGVAGDVQSENTASKLRVSGLGSIYGQAQKSAQDAFNQAKSILSGLILNQGATDQNARQNLAAALGAADTNVNSLSQMMGGTETGDQAAHGAFGAAVQGRGQISNNLLNNLEASQTGELGQMLASPGEEKAYQGNIESQRHLAATTGLEQNRQAILKLIPGIVEKERQSLMQNLQGAEGLRFQQGLAAKQFGLQQQSENFNETLKKSQFGEQQRVDTANITHQTNVDELNKILARNTIAKDNAVLGNELNKARGQQEANAIAQITEWLKPTAQELTSSGTQVITDPKTGAKITTKTGGQIDPKRWHRDVGAELDTLVTQFGLSQQRALQLMYGLNTPIGGPNNGTMTIGQWAKTFYQRQKARTGQHGVANAVGGAARGVAKGATHF